MGVYPNDTHNTLQIEAHVSHWSKVWNSVLSTGSGQINKGIVLILTEFAMKIRKPQIGSSITLGSRKRLLWQRIMNKIQSNSCWRYEKSKLKVWRCNTLFLILNKFSEVVVILIFESKGTLSYHGILHICALIFAI